MINKLNIIKDATKIPFGIYCYDNNGRCPYWDKDREREEQDNGYCHYLEAGDWEHEGVGLLWDQCKECGINED